MEVKKAPGPARSGPMTLLSLSLLPLAALISGCANQVRGKLIDLDSGEEIALQVNLASRTYAIEATLADGNRVIDFEYWRPDFGFKAIGTA